MNPTKRFSGYSLVEDEKMAFKQGIIFENGAVVGGFTLDEPSKKGRVSGEYRVMEICGFIETWGYNYSIRPDGSHTEPYPVSYGQVPIFCIIAPEISPGFEGLPTNNYDGYGSYYNPPPYQTEQEFFEANFVVEPAFYPIPDVRNYLKCFSNVAEGSYKLTVSVDQPEKGTNRLFVFGEHAVGHTYLTLTQVNPNGDTIQRTLGFYPRSMAGILFPNLPGALQNDSEYSGGWDVQITFSISGSELMRIVDYIPNYPNAGYDLKNRNCGNFALDVLSQIGINVAPHWMNTYWYTNVGGSPFYVSSNAPTTEIRGPSIGALGQQLYLTPPMRASSKSNQNGSAPRNIGNCN